MSHSTTQLATTFIASIALASLTQAGVLCSCTGDINDDFVVDGADLGILLSAWGTAGGPANLNGDGVVDGADLGLLLSAWGPCAAPANDLCGGALPLMLGDTPFCTNTANTDGPDFAAGVCGSAALATQIYKDIWYSYAPIGDGTLTVSTCNTADFDTMIAVYGSIIPGLSTCPSNEFSLATLIGCNDDTNFCPGNTSLLEVDLAGDSKYKVRLGGFFFDSGEGTLHASFESVGAFCFTGRPINESITDQILTGTTLDNPSAAPPLDDCQVGESPAEWFYWVAPCDGEVTLDTCQPGTDYDTTLHVYRETITQGCAGIFVECDDDGSGVSCQIDGLQRKSRLSFPCSAGLTYNIRVGGFMGDAGNFELRVQLDCN